MDKKIKIEKIIRQIKKCKECGLCRGRHNVVVGEGSLNAKLMIVGEAPGKNEDEIGMPFVGRSGKLLDKMLEAINLIRNDVYITNMVKCRPSENRNPFEHEMTHCFYYLKSQIEIIDPEIILCLGLISSKYMTGYSSYTMGKLRTLNPFRMVSHDNIDKIFVFSYHPAALLRDPSRKVLAWEDLKVVRNLLEK